MGDRLEDTSCNDLPPRPVLAPHKPELQEDIDPYEDPAALDHLPNSLCRFIASGISQGIAGLKQQEDKGQSSRVHESARQTQSHRRALPHEEQKPASPSLASEGSIMGEEAQCEIELSEDEDTPPPDPPAFSELFTFSLFKPLLHKA